MHQHRHSGGQAFRNAKSSQRMIISAGKMGHRAARYPSRESGRGLLRAPQKSHRSASGRRAPTRNPTDETALCGTLGIAVKGQCTPSGQHLCG